MAGGLKHDDTLIWNGSNRSFIKKGTAIKLGEKEVRDRKVMFAK